MEMEMFLSLQAVKLLLLTVLLEVLDVGSTISYKNEYTALGKHPAATNTGYFFTVDGDDNPYVNINITAGGVGDVRAKLITEYSSVDLLNDIDITSTAITAMDKF